MYIHFPQKCPLFFSYFNKNFVFLDIFSKMSKCNFAKMRPVRAEFFHADRRTDTHDEVLTVKTQQDATVYHNFIIPYFK